MTEEEKEAIDRLNRFKTIEILYSNTFAMHIEQLKTVQEDIETVLNMLKEKDKEIDLILDVFFKRFRAQLVLEYGIENKEQLKQKFEQYFERRVDNGNI